MSLYLYVLIMHMGVYTSPQMVGECAGRTDTEMLLETYISIHINLNIKLQYKFFGLWIYF